MGRGKAADLSPRLGQHVLRPCGTQVHWAGHGAAVGCSSPRSLHVGCPVWVEKLSSGWTDRWTDGMWLKGLSSHRQCAMSALVCPHLGLCLWLWLGVALGRSQGQGKDMEVLPGNVAPVSPDPTAGHPCPGHRPHSRGASACCSRRCPGAVVLSRTRETTCVLCPKCHPQLFAEPSASRSVPRWGCRCVLSDSY